jgi:hypothetical protein
MPRPSEIPQNLSTPVDNRHPGGFGGRRSPGAPSPRGSAGRTIAPGFSTTRARNALLTLFLLSTPSSWDVSVYFPLRSAVRRPSFSQGIRRWPRESAPTNRTRDDGLRPTASVCGCARGRAGRSSPRGGARGAAGCPSPANGTCAPRRSSGCSVTGDPCTGSEWCCSSRRDRGIRRSSPGRGSAARCNGTARGGCCERHSGKSHPRVSKAATSSSSLVRPSGTHEPRI